MANCSECRGPAHLPEECPAATRYGAGGNGACEWYYVTRDEGRHLAATLGWGTEAYYQAVIDGTQEMHDVSECRV